jgi:hypothetical protein
VKPRGASRKGPNRLLATHSAERLAIFTPSSTRRTAVCGPRMYGGVGGEDRRLSPLSRLQRQKVRSWSQGKKTELRANRGSLGEEFVPDAQSALRGLLRGKRGATLTMAFGRPDHLHLLPVIREFSAAIQAGHISSSKSGCLRTACGATNRDGKTVTRVPTTEKSIEQFCDHGAPSTSRAGYSAILIC